MIWSAALHGALLVFLVIKEAVLPSEPKIIPPALRVDLVGLPDVLKKDLAQLRPLPAAEEPPPEVPEPKKAPTVVEPEAPDPEEMLIKEPEKPKPKEKEKPKPAEKPVERADEKAREKKISNALARIRSLERLKDEANREDADERVQIRGNQISRGSSTSSDAKESLESSYYDQVRTVFAANWSVPPWLSRQKFVAQVRIQIDASGNISQFKFQKFSGSDAFDAEVRNTLKLSQPLPRPPKELLETLRSEGILVGFPL